MIYLPVAKVTNAEKKKYVLSAETDYEILGKIKQLEKLKLSKHEKELVKFLKTQLKKDWRTPLLKLLDRFLSKHSR